MLNPSFSHNFHHHQFILPKKNFYHQNPNLEETFSPTDQVTHFFAEANNNSVQLFDMGQPNLIGKGNVDTKTKGRTSTTQRGRKKKDGDTTQPCKGKRPALAEMQKEVDVKKLKQGDEAPTDLVNFIQTLTAVTGSTQSHRSE